MHGLRAMERREGHLGLARTALVSTLAAHALVYCPAVSLRTVHLFSGPVFRVHYRGYDNKK
jgi:hypothetical protein